MIEPVMTEIATTETAMKTRSRPSAPSERGATRRLLVAALVGSGALLAAVFASAQTSTSTSTATTARPAVAAATVAVAPFQEITWNDLVPKDWDPMKRFRGANVSRLSDSDPRSAEMLQDMRAAWDNAPTVSAMDGRTIKLPGYIVPLDVVDGRIKEFLLVPYFGACIHTPPPPANQIVFVVPGSPVKGFKAMDTVWVRGRISATRQASDMGESGYRIEAVGVDAYVAPTATR